MVTETWIHQVQFSVIFQALHNHNFQISDTASNKLHTVTQSQLTAPAEWYKHSSQIVSSVIKYFVVQQIPVHWHTNVEVCDSSKSRRYSCHSVLEQETWELEKQLHAFFFSALQGHQWSASCHGHFTTNERSLKHPLKKRLAGSQTQFRCFGEENYLLPLNNNSMVICHTAWTPNH